MVAILEYTKQSWLNWFYHLQRCLGCQQSLDQHSHWCSECLTQLTPIYTHRCLQCALPIASGDRCGHCLHEAPYFDETFTFDDYRWPLAQFVQQFKHRRQTQLAQGLAELFYSYHPDLDSACLCPVPMHWRKRWQRGFNQSELLARALAKQFRLPYRSLFSKPKSSADLIGLSRKQRQHIVKNSYQLLPNQSLPDQVTLVDDVMTTGATLNELARQLKQAGVAKVDCWVLARTPVHHHPSENSL
ncbi:ComF family protein [Celerinatantimonas sp. YJH-8]|uniref:ComF family protein n=1 Tax=Celerinatantimonas sp. YJH-8 TaxID=3228714 RepID=UPI0038C324E9